MMLLLICLFRRLYNVCVLCEECIVLFMKIVFFFFVLRVFFMWVRKVELLRLEVVVDCYCWIGLVVMFCWFRDKYLFGLIFVCLLMMYCLRFGIVFISFIVVVWGMVLKVVWMFSLIKNSGCCVFWILVLKVFSLECNLLIENMVDLSWWGFWFCLNS